MVNKKIELLEDILNSSKEFFFNYKGVLKIRKYYNTQESINIDFVSLIEIMEQKLSDTDIDRILLSDTDLEAEEDY